MPLYEGLECGGSFAEEGVEQPAIVPSGSFGGDGVDGCHYWWPRGVISGFFFDEKYLGNHFQWRKQMSSFIVCFTESMTE